MNYSLTSGEDADKVPRLDWVTVKEDNEKKPIQLLALLEISFPSDITAGKTSCMFFFIAADTEKVSKMRNR